MKTPNWIKNAYQSTMTHWSKTQSGIYQIISFWKDLLYTELNGFWDDLTHLLIASVPPLVLIVIMVLSLI